MIYSCLIDDHCVETWSFPLKMEKVVQFRSSVLGGELTAENGLIKLPSQWMMNENASGVQGAIIINSDNNYHLCSASGEDALLMLRNVDAEKMKMHCYVIDHSLTIGRSSINDLCYRESFVSSVHGNIRQQSNHWTYTDTSSNGTFINGEKVCQDEVILQKGDHLLIAPSLHLCFQNGLLTANNPNGMLHNHLAIFPSIMGVDAIPIRLQSITSGMVSAALLPMLPETISHFWKLYAENLIAPWDRMIITESRLFTTDGVLINTIDQLNQMLKYGNVCLYID